MKSVHEITDRARYNTSASYNRLALTGILLFSILCIGWFVTSKLADYARENIINEGKRDINSLAIFIDGELNKTEAAVKSLSGSPGILPALISRNSRDIENANAVLDRYNYSFGGDFVGYGDTVSYLMDAEGMTIASSNRHEKDSFVGHSYRFRDYYEKAIQGACNRYFAVGITSGIRGFYAGCPVRDREGTPIGVAVMKKNLDSMETSFKQRSAWFLINDTGIIFLSNRQEMFSKSLWPVDEKIRNAMIASRQFGDNLLGAVMEEEIIDGADVTWGGIKYHALRRSIASEGWSIVMLTAMAAVNVYVVVGVVSTLFVSLLIAGILSFFYIMDRERRIVQQGVETYRSVFENSGSAMVIIEKDRLLSMVNSQFEKLSGYAREEIEGKKMWTEFVFDEDLELMNTYHLKRRSEASESVPGEYEFRFIDRSSDMKYILLKTALLPGTASSVASLTDITTRKSHEQETAKLSITDPLTGLYNRRGFLTLGEHQLKEAKRTQQQSMVLFIDLDGLKIINDTLGHDTGDEALVETATILTEVYRESDIIARLGGDEFAVCALCADTKDRSILRERLQQSIVEHNARENRAYRLAMSVGIAVTDCDKLCSIDDLLSRADARMYEEKKKKSNAKSSIRSGCVADEAIAGIDGLSENTP